MLRAYKYRIYPSREQTEYICKCFGHCRFVYNRTLDYMSMMWSGSGVSVSRMSAQAQLPILKECFPWLSEVNAQSLQYAVKQVAEGYKNFFGKRARHPHPKTKKSRQSFHNPQNCSVDWKHETIDIPKCKGIRAVLHRPFYGRVKDVTVSRDCDGSYYASVLVDTAIQEKACEAVEPETTIGIDTGVKTFAVCSDGRTFGSRSFNAKAERLLERRQRELRHMTKGSRRWNITQRRIASIHAHTANQRLDYIHKVTYSLTHDSQVRTICIEDLDVREWMRHRQLAYKATDVSVGKFYEVLKYKCQWYGVNLITIDRWSKSSKTCSVCGAVNTRLKLSQRAWVCPECGTHHDRDFNASVNIRNIGLGTLPVDSRKVTPADCPTVDDRRICDLRSSDRMMQEKFCGVTDAPAL